MDKMDMMDMMSMEEAFYQQHQNLHLINSTEAEIKVRKAQREI
jgi:hypothetical protein